jgi:squalene-associated FAD-dependent desaturase
MAEGRVHVVGAGLAGLSAAIRLAERGRHVVVHEANPFAGGRCRTFHDPRLGRVIDNGNHLILSGNRSAMAYLTTIGSMGRMVELPAHFAFTDLADGSRWTIAPNAGPLPWWIAAPGRRVPGGGMAGYLAAMRLALAGAGRTVAEAITDRGPLWRRFWEPLTLAAINAPPERAAAHLLWPVLRETFLRGERHCRPVLAPEGLGGAFVAPAVAWLEARGVELRFGRVLRAVDAVAGRAKCLRFADGDEDLGAGDGLVLALPPSRLRAVLPMADPPDDDRTILNVFFRLHAPLPERAPPLLGVVSGTAQWIFLRGDVASVTVSAAGDSSRREGDSPSATIWRETRSALCLAPDAQPIATRINRERRATFDQSPAEAARRLAPQTLFENLVLAGDSTDTGLPATIEGAIRSGERAAQLIGQSAPARK